ncbi:hypothetical protein [Glutamicibacter sp.]|uniref:hypothetical protein n=1 Tax=Glutamicibacter sp. TaxID=1931995 RepID=UPI0028BDF8AA|nr:hypothetical protein [Glutamicibacter sp.]
MTEQGTKSGIDRRTIVKGAAWAVPVVAAATAVPMASASVPADPADVAVTVFGQSGQLSRGIETHLIDENFQPVPFPEGTTLTITVTSVDGGTITNPSVTGATPNGSSQDGDVYTFNYIVPPGETSVTFKGDVTGTVIIQATYTGPFGTLSSDPVTVTGA